MRTELPMSVVSPITMPVPWSMKNDEPMRAPGWMSMPVRDLACSVNMRGTIAAPSCSRRWATR